MAFRVSLSPAELQLVLLTCDMMIVHSLSHRQVAFAIITKLLDDFTEANNGKWSEDKNDNCMAFPDLEQIRSLRFRGRTTVRDQHQIDSVTRELEETKQVCCYYVGDRSDVTLLLQVLYNTIDAVLARG
eukprot:767123-Hanusia_phi.AAC.1